MTIEDRIALLRFMARGDDERDQTMLGVIDDLQRHIDVRDAYISGRGEWARFLACIPADMQAEQRGGPAAVSENSPTPEPRP